MKLIVCLCHMGNFFLVISFLPFNYQAIPLTSIDEGLVHPGLVLKYSVYKNLATIALQSEQLKDSLQYYLQVI